MASIQKRIEKGGKITYKVQVRLKGAPDQVATFDRLTDAKHWGQQTEADIRAGRHFKSEKAKKHTFSEFIDRYIAKMSFQPRKSVRKLKSRNYFGGKIN